MPTDNSHVTPTKEELAAKVQEAIDADQTTEDQSEEEEEVITPKQAESEEVAEEVTESEEIEEEEQAEPSPEEKEVLKQKLEAEKKKSSASARENQKIYAKNRVINKALVEAEEIPEPTEEELAKEFVDWDVMSDFEKTSAKEMVVSRNFRKVISQAREQATKIEKWNDSVEEFVTDPQVLIDNPELEGKAESFKTFATDEANNSVPFKILVSAFLHDQSTKKVVHKGQMFERGMGGSNEKPSPKKNTLTLEESRKLRDSDYGLWKEKLAAGLIEIDL